MKSRGDMGFEEFCDYLEQCTEKVVAVHLADGDTITTRIHGTGRTFVLITSSALSSISERLTTGLWKLLRLTSMTPARTRFDRPIGQLQHQVRDTRM